MQGKVTHLVPFLNPVVHESLSESAHKGGMLARSQPVPARPDAIGKAKQSGVNHLSQHQCLQVMAVGGWGRWNS